MASRDVVTCVLRHGTDVLLVRRSDAVGADRGRWAGVSGSAAGADPEAAARRVIDRTVGLLDAATLVRSADPLAAPAHERDTERRVHPFLFDCEATDVDPSDAVAAHEWVQPPAILERDTVPALWSTYRAVAPSVDSVASDTDHGSAYVSLRALEVLRDAAAAAATDDRTTAEPDAATAVLETAARRRPTRGR